MGMKTVQWHHQAREYDAHRDSPERALLWQMRTGKSKHVCDVGCHQALTQGVDGVLLLAPNGVHRQWLRKQLPAHWWDEVPYLAHAWDSMAKHRNRDEEAAHDQALERVLRYRDGVAVLAVNSEALINERAQGAIRRFLKGRRVLAAFDECDDFRSPGSRRSKIARGLRKHLHSVRILTGTVIANSPLAAWAQYELLRKGALGYDTYTEFKNSFALYHMDYGAGGRTFPRLTGYRDLERLKELMAPWSSVVLRADCDDLPELVPILRNTSMSEEADRVYNQMKKELVADIREGVVVQAVEGGVRRIKLQQALSGFMIDEQGAVHSLGDPRDNPRIADLMREIAGTDGKFIVWCQFREDIRRVCAALDLAGVPHVEYHGGVGPADRDRALDLFQGDPLVRGFVGQPRAGGRGLDLSAAEAVMWYSHTSDAITRLQAMERATQMGGRSIAVVDFEVPQTIDTMCLREGVEKGERADSVAGSGLQQLLRFLEEEDGAAEPAFLR